jgi:sigma-B regulation protein RsbU (phosphoserine phosphatase)
LASHISIAIENSRLFENEKKEKESMIAELKEAKEIQSRLFPKKAPNIPNFIINGICKPCQKVGGDWYDYIELPSGKIGIVLADVSGKGLSAAFLMSSARTIFRFIASSEESPAEVLKKVNNYLIEDLPSARFITLVYLILDPRTGKIVMSNAGHPWPLKKSRFNITQIEFDSGLLLGLKKFDYEDHEFLLIPGEKLFLYSDGVTEAMNAKHELLDDKFIELSLRKESADLYTLYNDVRLFLGNGIQSDDITIVEIAAK